MTPVGGKDSPRDWDHSGIGLDRYANLILRYGCKPTLFVSGEAARAHAPLLEELAARGADIGLFVAPAQHLDAKRSKHMGLLDAKQQAEALNAGISLFEHYVGYRPTALRTGLYSANASTYEIAATAGFRHIAFRMPGAALPVIGTVWDAELRMQSRLGMHDVPVTTNPSETLFNRFPLYLAPEVGTDGSHTALIERGKRAGLVCVTGATNADYWDATGSALRALESILDLVTNDPDLVPVPLSDLRAETPYPHEPNERHN
ncbi:MAG: hypothetical protein RLY87_956 [Chloroflexota bacterium]